MSRLEAMFFWEHNTYIDKFVELFLKFPPQFQVAVYWVCCSVALVKESVDLQEMKHTFVLYCNCCTNSTQPHPLKEWGFGDEIGFLLGGVKKYCLIIFQIWNRIDLTMMKHYLYRINLKPRSTSFTTAILQRNNFDQPTLLYWCFNSLIYSRKRYIVLYKVV